MTDNINTEFDSIVPGQIEAGMIESILKQLPEQIFHFGIKVVLAMVVFVIGSKAIRLLRKLVRKSLEKAGSDAGVIQFLDSFIKISLYIVILFLIASGFGVDATSAAAVIGSAGVAIGLALQGSLSNLAGGILILILKPFKVGDYIIEDTYKNEGTVVEVQIFYTKLITPDQKVIVLPNGTLANTSLTNVTMTDNRRLDLVIGISYSSNLQLAKKVLETIIDQDPSVILDQGRDVFVEALGNSAVSLGVRCYLKNDDYFIAKWRILEKIKIQFDENEIEIPYQKLDVHIK